ncbi:ATP-dependent helicase [bacterium]|nr:ATP-dependent helicase [bacterium]
MKDFKPNDSQREAILYVDGPLFLAAGPGSGKTRVLLWRTLNLIVFHQVDPQEIFLSTFTEKAAFQLKEGLIALLGLVTNKTGKPYDISKMSIGTVHSICQKLISDRRLSNDGHRAHPPVLLDELDQYFHVYREHWPEMIKHAGFKEIEDANRAVNLYLKNGNNGSRHEATTNAISFFNRMSEELVRPAHLRTKDESLIQISKMYDYYLNSLGANRKIRSTDFSLLQQAAYESLTKSENGHKIFRHVIIDEYQDTNAIQEKIYFHLAKGSQNICIVGDDDQALYRFRGATVENFVEFEERCKSYIKAKPRRIDLDINYRSRKRIVDFYTSFMDRNDWKKDDGKGFHRIADKKIKAKSTDKEPSVAVSSFLEPELVYEEIAAFTKKLITSKRVSDPNQIAFLFPSLKTKKAAGLKAALENVGLSVYAPRAGTFVEVEEAVAMFGLFAKILGRPERTQRRGNLANFFVLIDAYESKAEELMKSDDALKEYVKDKQKELDLIGADYDALMNYAKRKKIDLKTEFKWDPMVRDILRIGTLSERARKIIQSKAFENIIKKREVAKQPFPVQYIFNRMTSVDWSVLDLFYQLCGFKHFRKMFDLAERGSDEGPICNLGLISQYLARFMEKYATVITAGYLSEKKFVNSFFTSYLYALFRLGESEYEDADDPFPKGRIPFLTIHQAKGLEFPVVVLGSVFKTERKASQVEHIVRECLKKEGEPLDRISVFDNMRTFYVALSRPKNLLIIPRYKGTKGASPVFKEIFAEDRLPTLKEIDIKALPQAVDDHEDLGKVYSYTGDYLLFQKCPRQYMVFRKYGFVPSRSQTMFFGSLVHKTIEDLHYFLIQQRESQKV